eukprot:6203571-Pleurochrysis_carterae.AAC.2
MTKWAFVDGCVRRLRSGRREFTPSSESSALRSRHAHAHSHARSHAQIMPRSAEARGSRDCIHRPYDFTWTSQVIARAFDLLQSWSILFISTRPRARTLAHAPTRVAAHIDMLKPRLAGEGGGGRRTRSSNGWPSCCCFTGGGGGDAARAARRLRAYACVSAHPRTSRTRFLPLRLTSAAVATVLRAFDEAGGVIHVSLT